MLLLLSLHAFAAPPSEAALRARLAEVAPQRAARLLTAAEAPTNADISALAAGNRVVRMISGSDGPAGGVYGIAVMDVDIGTFWAALNDDEAIVGRNAVRYARVVAGTPCQDRHSLQVVALPLLDDRWYVNEVRVRQQANGAVRELAWHTVVNPGAWPLSAPDLAAIEGALHVTQNEGAWWLVQLGPGQVLVEYTLWTDPGGNVPAGPAARLSTLSLGDTFDGKLAIARAGNLKCG